MTDFEQVKQILETGSGRTVTARGWFRYLRKQSKQIFGHLYDGSSHTDLQCVFLKTNLPEETWNMAKSMDNGSCVELVGDMVDSPARGQDYELIVKELILYGQCDMSEYPLVPKKGFTFDYYRQFLHLRPRVKVMQSIMRIRATLDYATHEFFRKNGYLRLHTPCITASDCEGAGETFEVNSLSRYKMSLRHHATELEEAQSEDERKRLESALEAKKFFFGQPAFLTVSGQLDAEAYACGMGRVYTFGPTFRAENSNTYRHLAEFWMIEPEMAFMTLKEDMEVAQAYVQYCLQKVLEEHREDLIFLEEKQENGAGLIERLERICQSDFPRVSYTSAIELLQTEVEKGVEFDENEIMWGMDLASEHEKHLVSVCFDGQPIVVHGYPSKIKAFYMHENEPDEQGRETVAAMDMLVPGIGELIGGSQREVRTDILEEKMKKAGLEVEQYRDYLDLRRYGNVPHSGFGLGFERLVMLATATHHIRDVIPFPRAVALI